MTSLYSLDQRFSLVLDCYKVGYPYHYGVEKKVLLLVHFMAGLNRFLIRDMIFLILKGIELLVSRK